MQDIKMPYTTEESGLMNNFANEPAMYEAEPPTEQQKKKYWVLGALSALLITGLVVVAVTVS